MPRPEKDRVVHTPPFFADFKPIGLPVGSLEQVQLNLDEFEAFRLADYNNLSHEDAAIEMEISRSTFTRLIEKARKKIACLIIEGKVLSIDGGNIHFRKNIIRCRDCGHMFITKMGASFDVCPECSSKNLFNLAGGFGHGRCCAKNNQNGGYHARKKRNRP